MTKPTPKKKTRINLFVSDEMLQVYKYFSQTSGESVSFLIRKAMKEYAIKLRDRNGEVA